MGFRAIKNALSELGEAAKSIPEETRVRYPDVDWKGFAGLRDLMAHQYFVIDTRMLLPIIRDETPVLLRAVECELQEFDPPGPMTLCKPASLRVQAEVRALEARLADMGYSGVLCCSMYWRMMLIGAPPQDAAK
jgi:Protein of unknown function DUF86